MRLAACGERDACERDVHHRDDLGGAGVLDDVEPIRKHDLGFVTPVLRPQGRTPNGGEVAGSGAASPGRGLRARERRAQASIGEERLGIPKV